MNKHYPQARLDAGVRFGCKHRTAWQAGVDTGLLVVEAMAEGRPFTGVEWVASNVPAGAWTRGHQQTMQLVAGSRFGW